MARFDHRSCAEALSGRPVSRHPRNFSPAFQEVNDAKPETADGSERSILLSLSWNLRALHSSSRADGLARHQPTWNASRPRLEPLL